MTDEDTQNPAVRGAIRLGLSGIAFVTCGIVWVFVRPEGAMFGAAEALAVAGMLMIMAAAYKAAEAQSHGD